MKFNPQKIALLLVFVAFLSCQSKGVRKKKNNIAENEEVQTTWGGKLKLVKRIDE